MTLREYTAALEDTAFFRRECREAERRQITLTVPIDRRSGDRRRIDPPQHEPKGGNK